MKITPDQRDALTGLAKRAITEGWYGYHMDYQSGIAAVGERLGSMFPSADSSDLNELAVEIGNSAMTEIEES